ncbi:MAG: hypothetical protein ACLFQK_00830 [Fibrobacterota bacterium]
MTGSDKKISILNLCGIDQEAEIISEFHKNGYSAKITTAESFIEFCEKIAGSAWNLVLCPNNPHDSAITSAIKHLGKKLTDEAPFIVINNPGKKSEGLASRFRYSAETINQLPIVFRKINYEEKSVSSTSNNFFGISSPAFIIDGNFVIIDQNEKSEKEFGKCKNRKCHEIICKSAGKHDNCSLKTALRDNRTVMADLNTADRKLQIFVFPVVNNADDKLNFMLIAEKQESEKTMLPVCSYCRRIRAKDSAWERFEDYFHKNKAIYFSHTICPSCHSLYIDSPDH